MGPSIRCLRGFSDSNRGRKMHLMLTTRITQTELMPGEVAPPNTLKAEVPRDGIEPPTRGFSVRHVHVADVHPSPYGPKILKLWLSSVHGRPSLSTPVAVKTAVRPDGLRGLRLLEMRCFLLAGYGGKYFRILVGSVRQCSTEEGTFRARFAILQRLPG